MRISLTLQSWVRLSLICALLSTMPNTLAVVNAQSGNQVLVPDPTFGTAGTLHLPNEYNIGFAQVIIDHVLIRQEYTTPQQKAPPDVTRRLCQVDMAGQLGTCTGWLESQLVTQRWQVIGVQSDGRILYLDNLSIPNLKRLDPNLNPDPTFSLPKSCLNYNTPHCYIKRFDDRIQMIEYDPDPNSLTAVIITSTLLTPNGGYAGLVYTTTYSVAPTSTIYYASYIDESAPISASIPFSAQIIHFYAQTTDPGPPCRWEVYAANLKLLGSASITQLNPCIATSPIAHPDGGLLWMEKVNAQSWRIHKSQSDFSPDAGFGLSGAITVALTTSNMITSTQLVVQPDGRLLTMFEVPEGWVLKQFDRDGSHEQWLALLTSDVAPVLSSDGKMIVRRGNVMMRYHKITIGNLTQRVLLPVIAR